MKVYHLASFTGNAGDMLNHTSFYQHFNESVQKIEVLHQEEIRDYYYINQLKKFDENFVNEVNKYDLFILGGGNFFELCWNYSNTGTTFDIKKELLKKIKIPILINAIGIDDSKGINSENIQKFKEFLRVLFKHTNCYFTIRNDGSSEVVEKYFSKYKNNIHEVPDWGFIYKSESKKDDSQVKYIGLNIVNDLKEIRYKEVEYTLFLKTLARELNEILSETDYDLLFLPHILSDFQASLDLIQYLDNKYKRSRVSIAPLLVNSPLEIFKYYQKCILVYGMRFHSNIGSYALGIPVIGIHNLGLHNKMQEACSRNIQYYLDISKSLDGLKSLKDHLTVDEIENNKLNIQMINNKMLQEASKNLRNIKKWMKSCENR